MTQVEDTTTTYVTHPPVGDPSFPRSNGIGLAGFICSLVGFIIPVLFFPAIICSVIGMRRTNQNPVLPYRGLSIAGTIISSLVFAAFAVVVAIGLLG